MHSIAVSSLTSGEKCLLLSYLRIRFANSPPPVTISEFVPFSFSATLIASDGKRLPPIFTTHSIIISPYFIIF
ncbi:MAG: hypothetical protein PUC09_07105 [Methanobrevibacter wolinii]|nr:hypothetical protein [Methanobrevibacter wolinii]